ncbi:Copper-transporting ATPase 1 [Lamellibrachia satsuma]|nr:Copper-transporting ATPase 1 [Lamellibrachia satsuma]
MTCDSCSRGIEMTLSGKKGVKSINVSLAKKLASVTYDKTLTAAKDVSEWIEDMGFGATLSMNSSNEDEEAKGTNGNVCVFNITGMTCHSCARTIEAKLSSTDGIYEVSVSLEYSKATVHFDRRDMSPTKVVDAIEEMGFGACILAQTNGVPDDTNHTGESGRREEYMVITPSEATQPETVVAGMLVKPTLSAVEGHATLGSSKDISEQLHSSSKTPGDRPSVVELTVLGMVCASCVHLIESSLRKTRGVKDVSAVLATCRVRITYESKAASPLDFMEHVTSLGFETYLAGTSAPETDILRQKSEISKWRHSFQFSLIFGVPVIAIRTYFMLATMAYSHDHSSQGNSTDVSTTTVTMVFPGLSLENLLLFLFCTPCQCLGGRYFYVQAGKALRHGTSNMEVLITLATSVAYVYSVLVVVVAMATRTPDSPVSFFDTPPMLLVFVSLGRWLEHLAKAKTCDALTKLMKLQPTKGDTCADGRRKAMS